MRGPYWRAIADPFKRAIERHTSRPDYESHLGFTSDADRDIACLTAAVAPNDRDALAVFIDDLDRCSSAHLVEVVEAVNQIFNSDERVRAQRSVFVLGLDREAVAGSIEAAYGSMVDRLKAAGSPMARDFGFHFLNKLVQLSIGLPRPRLDRLPRLLTSERPSPLPEHPQAVEVLERTRQSEHVGAAEVAVLVHLGGNPRQAKRFHNVFRLHAVPYELGINRQAATFGQPTLGHRTGASPKKHSGARRKGERAPTARTRFALSCLQRPRLPLSPSLLRVRPRAWLPAEFPGIQTAQAAASLAVG